MEYPYLTHGRLKTETVPSPPDAKVIKAKRIQRLLWKGQVAIRVEQRQSGHVDVILLRLA